MKHEHTWYLYNVKEYEDEEIMYILRRCACGYKEEGCVKTPKFGEIKDVELRKEN